MIFILNNVVYINFSLEIVLHLWKSCKDTTEISLYPSFPTTHILCSHDTFIESKELMSVQVCFFDCHFSQIIMLTNMFFAKLPVAVVQVLNHG